MGKQLCVLVVDDDPGVRELLRQLLEAEGYLTEGARSAKEALEVCGSRPLAAALVDMRLGGADGLSVLRQFRDSAQRFPVVMMSAFPESTRVAQAREEGASYCLSKPFNLGQVRDVVGRLTGRL